METAATTTTRSTAKQPLPDDRHYLVHDNLGLAYNFASTKGRRLAPSLDPEDRRSACLAGLVDAARTFDPDLGKFTTCAYYWFAQHLRRRQHDSRLIHVPLWTLFPGNKGTKHNQDCFKSARRVLALRPCSINHSTHSDYFHPPVQPVEIDEDPDWLDPLRAALATLLDDDRDLLEQRFGLGGREAMSDRQIAEAIGINRQTVAIRCKLALRRLRRRLPDLEPKSPTPEDCA